MISSLCSSIHVSLFFSISTSAAPKVQKVAVGSDNFVPSRSRAVYETAATGPSSSGGSVTSASSSSSGGYAQQNFAKAKSISSRQYFGEDQESPAERAERQARLNQFQGAKSISSAAYFDRDEGGSSSQGNDCTFSFVFTLFVLSSESHLFFSVALDAGEIARRFAYNAKNDLQNVKEFVKDSGNKVRALSCTFRPSFSRLLFSFDIQLSVLVWCLSLTSLFQLSSFLSELSERYN